jgi:hypothetical protein
MTWDRLIPIIHELVSMVLLLGSVALGYWMGRNSSGLTYSSQPKTFDPGPKEVAPDPYAEALERLPGEGSRIPTI